LQKQTRYIIKQKRGVIMAKVKKISYECVQCGNEITVTTTGENELSPIYCCGAEILEIEAVEKSISPPKKKTAKKTVVRKKAVAKKKK
jgi:hypothetical protein